MSGKIDTKEFTDKCSKDPRCVDLYESNDYITAYSKHTDMRVKEDGPAAAIGGQWEEHGPIQLSFLRRMGLKPESTLLDFGCGTGRFTRHAVPFLNAGNYYGMDISQEALAHLVQMGHAEHWINKNPHIILGDGTYNQVENVRFDFMWSHSIFTHLPDDVITMLFNQLSEMSFGVYYFTFKKRDKPMRTGLKQFGYPPQYFIKQAKRVGLNATFMDRERWPQGQSTMKVW